MFDKYVERAAKPTSRRCLIDDIAFFVVSGTEGLGYYLDKDLDVIDSFRFTVVEFDEWIKGNDQWEYVTPFCCDPDLEVAEGL